MVIIAIIMGILLGIVVISTDLDNYETIVETARVHNNHVITEE